MVDVLLSINIPTYNRSRYLRQLLMSIFNNAHCLEQELIEVNIIDNASEDDTSSIINELDKKWAVNYRRNETNIGPMKNIQMAHRVGTGKYVWVVGDDDYIIDGQLEKIISYLIKSPDALLLSYARKTPTGESIGIVTSWENSCLMTKADPLFRLDYADKLIGFLSANIMRRDWVNSIDDEEYERLDEVGELAHAGMIFKAIGSGGTFAYIAKPTIVQTVDNGYLRYEYWKKVCFDYCNELPKFLSTIGFEDVGFEVQEFYQLRLRREIFRRLLSDKYRNKNFMEIFRDSDVRRFLSSSYFGLRLVSFIPNFLIVAIYNSLFTKRQ